VTPELDPYRAPTARLVERTHAGRLRIDGKTLVAPLGVALPEVCVITGEAQSGPGTRHERTLRWHPTWVALLILVNVFVMLVVAYFATRKTDVTFSMAPAEHRDRRRRRVVAWGAVVGGLLIAFGGAFAPQGSGVVFAGAGAGVLLVGLIALGTWARGLWARRIDGGVVHIRGITPVAMRAILEAQARREASEPDWRQDMFPPVAAAR
jgi:hypothetical protein